jgi:hypothetical protein
MVTPCAPQEGYEIGPGFRRSIEERIARLERDAAHDELMGTALEDGDHIQRHARLVAVQRAEAERMRAFLSRCGTRLSRPMIAL